jgi:hypothetical protein
MATSPHPLPTATHAPVGDVSTQINPFPPSPYISTPGGIPFGSIFTVVFFIILFVWFIYTLVVSYHWFRYGHRSWFAIPAIAMHLFVSGFCIIFAISGLQ